MINIDDAQEYADRLNERLFKAGWVPDIDFDSFTAEEILEEWKDEEARHIIIAETDGGRIYH